jgi:hypothetical protein
VWGCIVATSYICSQFKVDICALLF